jgi:hypothetical protein
VHIEGIGARWGAAAQRQEQSGQHNQGGQPA